MSPNRRDLMKIAAGLGLTAAVPTSAERIAAMQQLNERLSDQPLLDPTAFADAADGQLGGVFEEGWFATINPEQHTRYARARRAFVDAAPDIDGEHVNLHDMTEVGRLFWAFEEATFDFIMASYHAGLRSGAAYEHLRRTVIGELQSCRTCQGVGITRQGDRCATCGGSGMVAFAP